MFFFMALNSFIQACWSGPGLAGFESYTTILSVCRGSPIFIQLTVELTIVLSILHSSTCCKYKPQKNCKYCCKYKPQNNCKYCCKYKPLNNNHRIQERFSQPIIGLAEPIDDRLHNRLLERHFFKFRTWTVGRGNDIRHHSIRDVDLLIIAMICNNIFNAKHLVFSRKKINTINNR